MEHFHGARLLLVFLLANVFLSANTSGSERRGGETQQRQVRLARSGGGKALGVAPAAFPRQVRQSRGNYVRPVQQIGGGNTCQCTCGGSGISPHAGGGGGWREPVAEGRGEIDEIDNSGIPGWGPGCHFSQGNCPTHRPLKPVEEVKYNNNDQFASDLEYFMSFESPGKK